MSTPTESHYSSRQLGALALLRVLIGWHLLYEGVSKLANPDWTSAAYLSHAEGPLAGLFHAMAANSTLLAMSDALNCWGLTLIGLALLLGVFARFASLMGAVLLALYVLTNPVTFGIASKFPSEGSYLFVSKTMIEMVALYLLYCFPNSHEFGLDRYLSPYINKLLAKLESHQAKLRPTQPPVSAARKEQEA